MEQVTHPGKAGPQNEEKERGCKGGQTRCIPAKEKGHEGKDRQSKTEQDGKDLSA